VGSVTESALFAGRDKAAVARRPVLVGLIGKGIQMSRTPAMHEAEGGELGLNLVYTLLDTDRMGSNAPPLTELIRYAACFGFSGVNVTHPYKQEILGLLDQLSDDVAAVGSVNTVIFDGSQRIGHNTDLWGFRESFRRSMAGAAHDSVLLIGAGGAGGAVAQALLDCGTGEILVHDIQAARAESLAARLTPRFGAGRVSAISDIAVAVAAVDGVVNATPVGMAKLPGTPIDTALLHPRMWVADIVYFPLETEFLKAARRIGCRTMDGEGMAVFQAVRAFELFTGLAPSSERMQAAFAAFENVPAG
jgi:shikimate dehydrogenase